MIILGIVSISFIIPVFIRTHLIIDTSGPDPTNPRFGFNSVVRTASTTLFIALTMFFGIISLFIISFLIIGVFVYNSVQMSLSSSDI